MELIPTEEDVIKLLRNTGALRYGFFEYPNGMFSNEYLQVALAMRHYEVNKILSVGLSRKVRSDAEIRAMIPQLSVVAPATGGLPVAYGVCEALRARQVYWAESESLEAPLRFRQYMEVAPGEKVLLVDDLMRTGRRMTQLKNLVEDSGGQVVGIAVIIYQPSPNCAAFGDIPFFYLAKLESKFCTDKESCDIAPGQEPVKVWV
jgi:orotate phosphoribosyltransferase